MMYQGTQTIALFLGIDLKRVNKNMQTIVNFFVMCILGLQGAAR